MSRVETPQPDALSFHKQVMLACQEMVAKELLALDIEDRRMFVSVLADRQQYQLIPLDELSAEELVTMYGYKLEEAERIMQGIEATAFSVSAPVIVSSFKNGVMTATYLTMALFPGIQMQVFPISENPSNN